MPWRVEVAPRAEKELARLPADAREAIRQSLRRLTTDLGVLDVKKLGGRTGEWRLRVGRWRIIFEMDNRSGVLSVTRILPRDSAYRG